MIEEVIEALNKNTLDEMINTGLQIERLRSLRFWGIILLIIYIFLFPITSDIEKWGPYQETINHWYLYVANNPFWGQQLFLSLLPEISGMYTALSFCIIGGIGGFLSGLLQVRGSKTNLGRYEESVLLFQIRPIFGAFAALVIFMLLSWGVLTDILQTNQGSYALAAFLSGFSERYFLKLLMPASEVSNEEAPNADAVPENSKKQ